MMKTMILQRSQGTEFIKSKLVIFSIGVKATSLIRSESVSPLSLYLKEMVADRMNDDVKTETLEAGERS